MQIKGLHKTIYRAASMALSMESREEITAFRHKLMGDWETLRARGVPIHEIESITGISRSTYYRRKKALKLYGIKGLKDRSKRPRRLRPSAVDQTWINRILTIRNAYPTYGKAKITIIVKRDYGFPYSQSTVGRIVSQLIKQGKVKKYRPSQKYRRARRFDKHALRWIASQKPLLPGHRVQIDHMTVTKNGMTIKHFQAWDPVTKTIVAQAYSGASSTTAAQFLDHLRQRLGFELKSIQVDGGSEFMKHVEQKCQDYDIPLYVLPPKSPKLNGGVERGNRTFREDLYDADTFVPGTLNEVRQQLEEALLTYNSFRPHMNLGGLTPHQYAKQFLSEANSSHIL
jgi:transposase InsO family protein